MRKILQSKIHRATITGADPDYEGSITIPRELLKATVMHEYEAVHVWNVTRATRFETYTILGEPHSNDICVNGAAAHLVEIGDIIIIACFTYLPENELRSYAPRLVFVDSNNRILHHGPEIAGPALRC